jgi:sugar/nucleoside kinase (ribokinase family)
VLSYALRFDKIKVFAGGTGYFAGKTEENRGRTMPRFDCAFIGDLNPDMIIRGNATPVFGREVFCDEFYPALGGSAAICAGAFSNLGAKSCFFGRVGDDCLGEYVTKELASCGVDISGVSVRKGSYSPVTVSLTSSEDRALVNYAGTCGSLDGTDIPVHDIQTA